MAAWQRLQTIVILLLLLSFGLYLPSLFHDLFADDHIYLAYTNRFLRESNWSELYQFLLRSANPLEFLPVRDFTYWLDFRLYGDEPVGFHVTNLVWYAASGLASFWLNRELILLCQPAWAERATVLSLCGALLFVVHPAHVEVVDWIASRKDLVAGTLGLLSVAVLVYAMRLHWSGRAMLLSALLLGLACFGKAAAMTDVIFITVLIGLGWAGSSDVSRARKLSTLLLYWTLVALAFMIHFKVGESSGIRIENHPGLFPVLERASLVFTALIGILLLPFPLRFYYDVYQIGDWHWLVTASAVLLLLVSLRVLSQRRSLWALGVVLTLSPLVIYLQWVPFTTWSLASERFVFVPVAGLSLVLIDLLGRMNSPKKIAWLLLLIVLPCATLVWLRVADWGDRPALLVREYKLQPAFHNAVRDRIVFTLLPEKRYDEATVLARLVPRSYAAEALLSLIELEQAYQRMSETNAATMGNESETVRQDFCKSVTSLKLAIRNGYEHIPNEHDVSYNNILRTLDQQMKFRYANAKNLCARDGAVSE